MSNAWLIIAHNEFGILQQLLSQLDAPECDFFVHIDKKVKSLPHLKVERGRLFLLEKRIDVRWGHVSQIETELHLLETALDKGRYEHYHIISGTHLPLKPISAILAFFEKHAGEEVLRLWTPNEGDADFKLRRYHFPIRNFKSVNSFRRTVCQFTWRCVIGIQRVLGIRHFKDHVFFKSDNWMSFTPKAAEYLVSRKKEILKKYRWSFCADEYFAATELKEAVNIFKLYDCRHFLFVDFIDGIPRTLFLDEIPELRKTEYLFARKFSESISFKKA